MAVEGVGLLDGCRAVASFIRSEFSRTGRGCFWWWSGWSSPRRWPRRSRGPASASSRSCRWSALAVLPLQIVALLLRGLVFEYLGLTALGAYLTLYQGYRFATRRGCESIAVHFTDGSVGESVTGLGSGPIGVITGSMLRITSTAAALLRRRA